MVYDGGSLHKPYAQRQQVEYDRSKPSSDELGSLGHSTNSPHAALDNTRTIGVGPRNFEPRSCDENDSEQAPPTPLQTTTSYQEEDFELGNHNGISPPLHGDSLVASGLELATRRPRVHDHNN
ncbi:hypothetical protein TNCV_3562811 [Trichonephila clavipes]|nr:hypothetical protein TNCV_3562811 [Trichonephila clavipes]